MALPGAYRELQQETVPFRRLEPTSGESVWVQQHLGMIAVNSNQRHWNETQRRYATWMIQNGTAAGFVMKEMPLPDTKKERCAVIATDRNYDYEVKHVVPVLLGVGIMFERSLEKLSDTDLVVWSRTFDQLLSPLARDYLLSHIPAWRFENIYSRFEFNRKVNRKAIGEMRQMIATWKSPLREDGKPNRNHGSWSFWQQSMRDIMHEQYGKEQVFDPQSICTTLGFIEEQYQYQLFLHRKPTSGVKPMSGYEVVDIRKKVSYHLLPDTFSPVVPALEDDCIRSELLENLIATLTNQGYERAIKGTLEEQYRITGSVA